MADGEKGKRVGQAIAITTLTPVRRERQRSLARRLALVRYFPGLGRPLERLAFIYFARWTVVRELPPGRRLRSAYLLFESNFDGGRMDYLDAFADRLPTRIRGLWETCHGFDEEVLAGARGKRFPPGAFKRFVAKNELRVLHFYAAYSDATTRMVRQSIALAERLERNRGEIDPVAERLALTPAEEPRGGVVAAWWRAVTGRYGVEPLTLALPLRPDAAEAVVERLDRLTLADSPLAAVPGTHFARFVLIPRELLDLGQPSPDVLPCQVLLFTANHDGDRAGYLRALARAARWVWDACEARPDDDRDLPRWLGQHAIGTRYFVAGFPPRPADEIRQLVRRRAEVAHRLAREAA